MRRIILLLISVGLLGRRTCSAEDHSFPVLNLQKEMLLSRMAASTASIHRWTIEYEAVSTTGTGPSVHKIMSASDSGDYYHMMAHFSAAMRWNEDPFAQELFIHQGRLIHRWPFNRAYSQSDIKLGAFMPGTTWMDVLLPVLPIWPVRQYRMPPNPIIGVPILLPEILANAECRLMTNTESINGEVCSVFNYKDLERIWVATNKAFCPMRYDQMGRESRHIVMRLLVDNLMELAPGVFLPKTYRVQYFKTERGLPDRETMVRVLRCDINDRVTDASFIAAIPPGSITYDKSQNFTQIAPGGEDLLSHIADFIKRYNDAPANRNPDARRYLCLVAAFITGCVVSILGIQSRDKLLEHILRRKN